MVDQWATFWNLEFTDHIQNHTLPKGYFGCKPFWTSHKTTTSIGRLQLVVCYRFLKCNPSDDNSMHFYLTTTASPNLVNNTWAARPENWSSGFPTRSDTNRSVQPQKMARSLKKKRNSIICVAKTKAVVSFAVSKADLRLCFRICKNLLFFFQDKAHIIFWVFAKDWNSNILS